MDLTQKHESQRLGYLFAVLAAIMFGSVSVLAKPLPRIEFCVHFHPQNGSRVPVGPFLYLIWGLGPKKNELLFYVLPVELKMVQGS